MKLSLKKIEQKTEEISGFIQQLKQADVPVSKSKTYQASGGKDAVGGKPPSPPSPPPPPPPPPP